MRSAARLDRRVSAIRAPRRVGGRPSRPRPVGHGRDSSTALSSLAEGGDRLLDPRVRQVVGDDDVDAVRRRPTARRRRSGAARRSWCRAGGRPAGDRRRRSAQDLGPARASGRSRRRSRRGRRRSGPAPRRRRATAARSAPKDHVAAGEADLVDARVRQRAQVRAGAVAARSRASPAPRPERRRDRAPRAPGRRPAPSRRRCTRPSGRTTRPASAHAAGEHEQRPRAGRRRGDRGDIVASVPELGATRRRAVRPVHLVPPSRVVRRVRPTIEPGPTRDEGAIASVAGRGLMFWLRRPAIEPGQHPGASVTEPDTAIRSRMVRVGGSRIRFTSRITGSSANRPGGPSGRQQLIALSSISERNALRYRGAFSRPRRRASGGAAGRLGAPASGGRGAGSPAGRDRPG